MSLFLFVTLPWFESALLLLQRTVLHLAFNRTEQVTLGGPNDDLVLIPNRGGMNQCLGAVIMVLVQLGSNLGYLSAAL